jgi:preprotein translocase subunit YajC
MLISPAFAQAFGFGDSTSTLVQFAPILLIFVVFYFFLIRPQQQKAKDLKTMLAGLRRGDRIVTGGGIIGTIAKVASDEEVLVDIADNTRVRVLRSTITGVLAKTEPASAKGDKDEPEKTEGGADGDKGKPGTRRAAGGN